ncbi:MAG: amidohydrolase family protein [Intrasporangium sp.]|uniref:metal-dependent hydrolase family protein n=1 Tax=Intrasporangium sp. TaxID=1925024 RepID=UPI003F80AB23
MSADSRGLAIINAGIFDGESAELLDGPVVIRDGHIESIGAAARPTDKIVDAHGGMVLPGLIDAHCHPYGISLDMLDTEANHLSYVALVAGTRLRSALRRGFTTIRDVAGGDAGIARAIREGWLTSPRYLFTGAALSQTGGHGDGRPQHWHSCPCDGRNVEVVDGIDPLRVAVRERFRQGAHAIKIMASGGVISLTDPIRIPQYSAEEIRAVTDEATRRGSYVAAHAYSPEAIMHSVRNGVRSIEHGNLLDASSAAAMVEHDAFLVPTLACYEAMNRRGEELGMAKVSREKNQEVLEAGREAIEIAAAAGVPIGFGTDLMGVLEAEQLNGLRLQAEVTGMLELLRSATSRNARLIGRPDLGRVMAGGVADLLVLQGNPFEDGECLWSPCAERTVIQAGRVVHHGGAASPELG